MEHTYNAILSIFLGILIVLIFDQLFERPRVIYVYGDQNPMLKDNITEK